MMSTGKRKTICLNMIVKNEAHIIADTLEHLNKYIKFDYWVISDTGSTDATKEIIKEFYKKKGIPGELVEHSWKDFGYNRTQAFKVAYKKTDYVFVWDADDEISGNFSMPSELTADSYKFIFGNESGFRYNRCQLFNNNLNWCYKGVLHEYADCLEPSKPAEAILGDYYFISGRRGDRSKDPNKYLKDALVLEKGFTEAFEAKDHLYNRYAFYCAQSYNSCNMYEKSIEWYKKALTLNLWVQERYICCLEIYDMYEKLKKSEEGLRYLVESFKYDNERVECIYRLIKHYCIHESSEVAYAYYTLIQDFYENKYLNQQDRLSEKLFAKKDEHDFYLPYYMIIVSERTKHLETAAKMYSMIFKLEYLHASEWWIRNLIHNIQFCIEALPKDLDFLQSMLLYLEKLYARGIRLEDSHYTVIEKVINLFRPLLTAESQLANTLVKKTTRPHLMLSITSCKRLDLFTKTINSILNTWTDIDKVDYFFCVDDNSTQRDRSKMVAAYPFIDFYMKRQLEKGHRESMNIIYRKLCDLKPTYWIHLEDDWLFFKRDSYVEKAAIFLERYQTQGIHQILYNRNYAETYDGWTINGATSLEPEFLLHQKSDSIPGRNCGYWPHYSFRPSMIRVEPILGLGNYDSPNTFFERDYADKYYAKGYKSAFYDTVCSLHIGKLTSDKSGTNAYTLNKVGQFSADDKKPRRQNTFVINLLRRTDRKEAIEILFDKEQITEYEFYEAIDGKELVVTNEITNLFIGNDFGNRKGVIGCALSHYNLWKQLLEDPTNDYYVIFEDDFTVSNGFKAKYDKHLDLIKNSTYDMVFLGYHVRDEHKKEQIKSIHGKPIVPLKMSIYIGGFYSYLITKSGAKKLDTYIKENGIKHGIDYLIKIIPGFTCVNIQPHIVFSDWVKSSTSAVDTDIQKDYSSLHLINNTINKDDWIFYEGVDSGGSDICNIGQKSIDELFTAAEARNKCVAFNTLGFLKSNVTKPFQSTPYIGKSGSGLYVKKSYVFRECMTTRLAKKNTYTINDLFGIAKRCDWFIYHNGFINCTDDIFTSPPRNIFISAYNGRESLSRFINIYLPQLKSPFTLIIAGDDFTFPLGTGDLRENYYSDMQDSIQDLLENPLLEKIYVENLDTTEYTKLVPIPLGLVKNGSQGYHSTLEIRDYTINLSSRPILCFCCHRNRNGPQWELRKTVTSLCKNEWVSLVSYCEEMSSEDMTNTMLNSRFCICVRGGGYDPSPKCWEALINGCIPILQHSPLDEAYSRFPIVFVDEWTPETLTKEKLSGWLEDLRPFYEDPIKRAKVLEMLTLEYWWNTVVQSKVPNSQWISVKLQGGLGNRLFQISAALGLAEKIGREVVFYTPEILENPHQATDAIEKMFPEIRSIDTRSDVYVYNEPDKDNYTFLPFTSTETIDKPILIQGYRQSPKYFPSNGVHPKLEELIAAERWSALKQQYKLTTDKEKHSTWSIHIRLGDYAHNNSVNHITMESYYKNAITHIPSYAHILLFSDEPEKASTMLKPYLNQPYQVCTETDEIECLSLMSQCFGGAIVPNSTFSWWGAWFAHQYAPDTHRAFYPDIWRSQFGTTGKDCIPSWGTCIAVLDDWIFFQGFDSGGNDIHCLGKKPIDHIKLAANTMHNCVAFNTLGFLKSSIEYPLIRSVYYSCPSDGLYVKKQGRSTKLRVKMLCNWCSSEDLCKEWLKMSKGSYIWNNIQITWEDTNIDYYVIINKPQSGAYFIPEKTIIFHMEPWCGESWQTWGVKTWGPWAKPDPRKFLQVRSHEKYFNTGFWQLNMTYNDFKTMKIEKQKSLGNIISSVCSSKYFDPGHKFRIDFMKFIEAKGDPSVNIHIYNEDNQHGFQSYVGKAQPSIDKEKGVLPYKYYFMCENNAEVNFISEKLWEPILCESLCFYWGCPNVADYIDPMAYVQLDMNDFEASFKIIKNAIESDLWSQRLPAIKKAKECILEYYGFFPTLERVLEGRDSVQLGRRTHSKVCFIHSCTLEASGTEKLDLLLESICKSGLLGELDAILINNIGLPLDHNKYTSISKKIEVIHNSSDPKLFELPTLKLMHNYSLLNPGIKLLYLHTKGIMYSKTDSRYLNVLDWIHYMLYFLVDSVNYTNCLNLLSSYDTVGCNYLEAPHPHYSGNFWWSTTDYLKRLSTDSLSDKMSAEWWILSGSPKIHVLYSSNRNHFLEAYPSDKYRAT